MGPLTHAPPTGTARRAGMRRHPREGVRGRQARGGTGCPATC